MEETDMFVEFIQYSQHSTSSAKRSAVISAGSFQSTDSHKSLIFSNPGVQGKHTSLLILT